jgi:pimeloyl-ACP methyl ester carboxylesterase
MYSMLVAHDYPARQPELYFLYRGIAGFNPPRDPDFMTRGNPAPPPSPDDLKALKMPVLLIGGEEDATTPPDVMEGMQRSFAGARLEIVGGSGHCVHFEKPDIFNRLLDDFLRSSGA